MNTRTDAELAQNIRRCFQNFRVAVHEAKQSGLVVMFDQERIFELLLTPNLLCTGTDIEITRSL